MKFKKIMLITTVTLILVILLTIIASAHDFRRESVTKKTFINSSTSFNSVLYTKENPEIAYEYKNLKCFSESASMTVTLNARRTKWYLPFTVSNDTVATVNVLGINSTYTGYYGYSYGVIEDCSYDLISEKYSGWTYDECYNMCFTYTITGTNGYSIHNNQGEWLIHCLYDGDEPIYD